MANFCDFSMKIIGTKENIEKFCNIINEKDYNKLHVCGIYECYLSEIVKEENFYSTIIDGYCKWSVASSMMMDGYYRDYDNPEEHNITCIENLSEELKLIIEIYSAESGMQFSEHYILDKGNIELYDVSDYYCYFKEDYESYEDFIEKTNITSISKKEYENSCEYIPFINGEFRNNIWNFEI